MRAFFASTFLALVLLSLVAWQIQPAPPEGKIPLVWASDDNPARRGQVALFNELHPEYSLTLDPVSWGLEKIILQSLADVGPDLFDCRGPSQLDTFVKAGVAWDITDELAKRGIDPREGVWPAILPFAMQEGRVYGFPADVCVDALWINKDLFDAAGEPYPEGPWTWDELVEVARRLTVRDASGRIKQFGLLCDWWQWGQFVKFWGGHIYSEDGTRCVVDSPETIAAIQFMHDLMYKHHVMPTPLDEATMATLGGWGSGTISYFGTGKAAMAVGGRWWLCTLRDYEGLNLGAVELPHANKRVFRAYGRATLINSQSPRREDALNFILYLAGKDYNELINRQADGVGPVIRYCYTPEFLHNPEHPEEDYNEVWREPIKYAEPDEWSPFVNAQTATRILDKQMDLIKNNQKPVAEGLRDAAREVNNEIAKALQQDPMLRVRYYRLTHRERPE